MSQALEKSGFQPRKPTLERGRDRGDKGPRTRGAAQEGGVGRESRGCPGGGRGEDGAGPGDQRGRVEIVAPVTP